MFVGFFILFTSLVPFANAIRLIETGAADVSTAILRTLAAINAAGIAWIVAGWTWFKGRWWLAVCFSLIGLVLISVGTAGC